MVFSVNHARFVAHFTFSLAVAAFVLAATRSLFAEPCSYRQAMEDYCPGATSTEPCSSYQAQKNPNPPADGSATFVCSQTYRVVELDDFTCTDSDEFTNCVVTRVQSICTDTYQCVPATQQGGGPCQKTREPILAQRTRKGTYTTPDCDDKPISTQTTAKSSSLPQ